MDNRLEPTSILKGHALESDRVMISEITGSEIISVAIAEQSEKEFRAIFKKEFGKLPPKPGKFVKIKGGIALWTTPDQIMLILESQDIRSDEKIAAIFSGYAYTTLQTDGWLQLTVTGPDLQNMWERFVPIDFSKFKPGDAIRTQAHHMALIVVRLDEDIYRFISPRSTSQSFIRALAHII